MRGKEKCIQLGKRKKYRKEFRKFLMEDFKVFGKDVGGTERKEAKIRNILTINQIKRKIFLKTPSCTFAFGW
jgi:hypothetical protein